MVIRIIVSTDVFQTNKISNQHIGITYLILRVLRKYPMYK